MLSRVPSLRILVASPELPEKKITWRLWHPPDFRVEVVSEVSLGTGELAGLAASVNVRAVKPD